MPGPAIFDYKMQYHKVGGITISFEPANEDTSSSSYRYYGFLSSVGSWLIMRQDISVASKRVYKYSAGQTRTAYDTCWDADGSYIGTLEFVTFDQINASL